MNESSIMFQLRVKLSIILSTIWWLQRRWNTWHIFRDNLDCILCGKSHTKSETPTTSTLCIVIYCNRTRDPLMSNVSVLSLEKTHSSGILYQLQKPEIFLWMKYLKVREFLNCDASHWKKPIHQNNPSREADLPHLIKFQISIRFLSIRFLVH